MPLKIGCKASDTDMHTLDVTTLIYTKGKLYSGGDDGKIKAWTPYLKQAAEVQSNPCSIYSLAASEDTLYSCSDEGTIKGFDLDSLEEKLTLIRDELSEFWKLVWVNDALYSGDHEANIKVWKNNVFYGMLNVAEPPKDIAIVKNLVFSAKHLDIVVSDVNISGKKLQQTTRKTMMGRAPLTLIEDRLVAFLSREGTDILIHQIDEAGRIQELTKIQGASENITNALAGAKCNGKDVFFSGGWDKQVKKWILEDGSAKLDSSLDVDFVVNTITFGEAGEVYVGGSDGHLIRIDVE